MLKWYIKHGLEITVIHKIFKCQPSRPFKPKTVKECAIFPKNKAYDLLKTAKIGDPSIVFCRYAEKGVSKIRSKNYPDAKTCQSVIGFDGNCLYPHCSRQELLYGKEQYIEVDEPFYKAFIDSRCEDILSDELFGFCRVDIHVSEK